MIFLTYFFHGEKNKPGGTSTPHPLPLTHPPTTKRLENRDPVGWIGGVGGGVGGGRSNSQPSMKMYESIAACRQRITRVCTWLLHSSKYPYALTVLNNEAYIFLHHIKLKENSLFAFVIRNVSRLSCGVGCSDFYFFHILRYNHPSLTP